MEKNWYMEIIPIADEIMVIVRNPKIRLDENFIPCDVLFC